MTRVGVRTPASDAAGPWSEPGAMLALAAMAAYVVSTIKFMNRDPLSTTTGIQAVMEIAAVAASVVLAAIPLVRRRFFPQAERAGGRLRRVRGVGPAVVRLFVTGRCSA